MVGPRVNLRLKGNKGRKAAWGHLTRQDKRVAEGHVPNLVTKCLFHTLSLKVVIFYHRITFKMHQIYFAYKIRKVLKEAKLFFMSFTCLLVSWDGFWLIIGSIDTEPTLQTILSRNKPTHQLFWRLWQSRVHENRTKHEPFIWSRSKVIWFWFISLCACNLHCSWSEYGVSVYVCTVEGGRGRETDWKASGQRRATC